MNKSKAGLIVLVFLAAGFFFFIAMLFGSSTQRQAVINRNADLNAKLDSIAETDLAIYWIGEPMPELEHLMPVVKVIDPASASKDTLPVKGPAFHVAEYNPEGMLINEQVPKDYPAKMVIIITGSPELSDDGKEALLNAVAQNGVPALAIGDDAAELLGQILSYSRYHKGPGSSLYYCLGSGYTENPIPESLVKAGGMDLAEAVPDVISKAVSEYIPQN